MSIPDIERLRSIKTFPSLVKYLRDELDWPIDSEDFDALTFEYDAEELGLDAKTAVKVKEIKQLRPLVTNQPWGIFFINFEPKQLPVVVLRRILRALVLRKRQSANKPQQATWNLHDLLFISSYGETDHRDITFAHFAEEDGTTDLPTLRVLGWDDEDTVLHLADADKELREKLHWPEDTKRIEEWRKQWSSTFTLRPREVIGTSKALAERLAELATAIRKRVNKVLAIESESGALRKLMTAFREALIHDLKEDDFADMYAQTITYGLLTARVSRPAGFVAENVADMVPITNPFLRDMLSTFLTVGGRKGKIDFDELGINDVVQTLRDTDMEAVVRDFGDKDRRDDPVIYFYELFLKEYDPEKRTKRGVFYTPRSVVSFVVRSVDEILRKEFGLEDGLADTITWGEMAQRHKDLKMPKGVSPKEPFVQVLDPACGTGTFLVEVIDVIHRTMKAKWLKQGRMPLEFQNLWSEYVSEHLLPRLYGFELMMAPYVIAHMKLGLKLHETGYNFRSHERARIYLTNTLEEPKDFSDRFEFDAPALAHEAHAVNAVKRKTPFNVVVGNPPYSKLSCNRSEDAEGLVSRYKKLVAEERNVQPLSDDYIKFLAWSEQRLARLPAAVLSMITNRGYLSGLIHRGMRESLFETFKWLAVVDCHGDTNVGEAPPAGIGNENVFDIQQGVAISCLVRGNEVPSGRSFRHFDLWGQRSEKYDYLSSGYILDGSVKKIKDPMAPLYLFKPMGVPRGADYDGFVRLTEVFGSGNTRSDQGTRYGNGIKTNHDALLVAFERQELVRRIHILEEKSLSDEEVRQRLDLHDGPYWNTRREREKIRSVNWRANIRACLYRPFDIRWVLYQVNLIQIGRGGASPRLMRHLSGGKNLALLTSRNPQTDTFTSVFCTRLISEMKTAESTRASYCFPLNIHPDSSLPLSTETQTALTGRGQPNLNVRFLEEFSRRLGLKYADVAAQGRKELGPEDIFHYIYAVFHSERYRQRYAEFLAKDFPRVPYVSSAVIFWGLAKLGADLVALHILEDDYPAASWNVSKPKGRSPLQNLTTNFARKGDDEVAKGHPKYADGKVFISPSRWFEGVPEDVWNFHIGGYQVCEKWLKDRRGRVLSDEDTAHYQKIVIALKETIRLMAEIDKAIDAHGGWPGAFVANQPDPK